MRWLFIGAALLVALGIACGAETTPITPADTPTSQATQISSPTTASATATAPAPPTKAGRIITAEDTAPSTPTPTPTPVPTRPPLAAVAPQVEYLEDAVFIRLGRDPTTLDPHLTGDVASAVFIVEVFGGLVTLDRNLVLSQPNCWQDRDGEA